MEVMKPQKSNLLINPNNLAGVGPSVTLTALSFVGVIIPRPPLQGDIMESTEEHEKRIAEIIETTVCEKDFVCRGLKNLCKAKDHAGMKEYAYCLEPGSCQFKVPYGGIVFCRCPVRVYIVKNLHI
ncbi:hypothetical protein LCGC14_0691340 [marine sediment metagenome]|uniref:Uncharacterized protein n=1 Tax=marine sediment metagenome TaxID=412755 RepID=A0A0F9T6I0_9ZZZZ